MSTPSKPSDEKSYPWGNKSITHSVLVFFVAFNIIAVAVLFLAFVEIPFIQGENVFSGLSFDQYAYAQVTDNPNVPDVGKPDIPKIPGPSGFYLDCFIIIILNISIVIILIRVSYWIKTTIITQTRSGLWVIRQIYLWATYTVAIVSSVSTFFLIWICITTPRF